MLQTKAPITNRSAKHGASASLGATTAHAALPDKLSDTQP